MAFKQLLVTVQSNLISVEQSGKEIWLHYTDWNMGIRFRTLDAATDFFNDGDFSAGNSLIVSEFVSWEMNKGVIA